MFCFSRAHQLHGCFDKVPRETHDTPIHPRMTPLLFPIPISCICLKPFGCGNRIFRDSSLLFISRKLPQLWEGSRYGRWLYSVYNHSTLLLSVMARVILRCIGVSWVSLVISFLSQRNIKTPSRCKNTTAKYTKCFC